MVLLRSIALTFLVLIVLTGCRVSGKGTISKKLSASELREDARVFKDVTLAMHPAVGVYRTRAYYEKLFDAFIGDLHDSLTEKEFRLKAKLVADELHCGHTEVIYSNAYYRAMSRMQHNYSPYIFLPVENKVYVVANLNKRRDSTLKRGTEITRINGVRVDSMLRWCRRFVSSDGYNTTAKEYYVQLGFNSYYLGLFGRPDTFEVEYKDGQLLKRLRYPAIKARSLPALPIGPKKDSLFKKFRRAKIDYRFLDADEKTMSVKIGSFTHRQYGWAYRRIFKKMKKSRSENLIIDLRNNGGGSLSNTYRLLSYLVDSPETQTLRTGIKKYPYKKYVHGNIWFKLTRFAYTIIGRKKTVNDTDYFVYTIKPRRKLHFDGKVIVLINGGSFSASSLVAAYLKYRKHPAIFIGEETGGAVEGCNAGVTPYARLPHSQIRVRVPAFRVVHDVVPEITGHGVVPDHEIKYSYKDIISKRDLEMTKAKQLLNIR